jgi:electron transfer flavoprotein beta subunit
VKVAVCVKVVAPRTPLHLDPATSRLVPTGAGVLNGLDRNAVEEAVRLRERVGVDEIVVVAVTDSANLVPVREALAMGADRAVVVSDDPVAGSDLLAVSDVLASVLALEEPDLVLLGGQSDDANGAVMPAALAERLGWPVLAQAVALVVEGDVVDVDRQTETGYESLRTTLPCVVAVADGINVSRYPTLKGRNDARRKPVALLALADVGLGADAVGPGGSGTVVFALADPPVRPEPLRLDGPTAAADLLAYLVERELVR